MDIKEKNVYAKETVERRQKEEYQVSWDSMIWSWLKTESGVEG